MMTTSTLTSGTLTGRVTVNGTCSSLTVYNQHLKEPVIHYSGSQSFIDSKIKNWFNKNEQS